MNIKVIVTVTLLSIGLVSSSQEGKEEKKPPTIEELFSDLDSNKDGKLSIKEVKGPLKEDFDKIDSNKDGFLTIEELKKAPKPKRQMRLDK